MLGPTPGGAATVGANEVDPAADPSSAEKSLRRVALTVRNASSSRGGWCLWCLMTSVCQHPWQHRWQHHSWQHSWQQRGPSRNSCGRLRRAGRARKHIILLFQKTRTPALLRRCSRRCVLSVCARSATARCPGHEEDAEGWISASDLRRQLDGMALKEKAALQNVQRRLDNPATRHCCCCSLGLHVATTV